MKNMPKQRYKDSDGDTPLHVLMTVIFFSTIYNDWPRPTSSKNRYNKIDQT